MNEVIIERTANYVVTVDEDGEPRSRRVPPRILSARELPTDEQLFAIHRELNRGRLR